LVRGCKLITKTRATLIYTREREREKENGKNAIVFKLGNIVLAV